MSTPQIYGKQLNKHLKDLNKALVKQQNTLLGLASKAKTADEADAIVREMHEINFRVMICAGLLFKQTTAELDTDLEAVEVATRQLEHAIKQANTIADLLQATGKLLTIVDNVLDAVKLV